MPRAMCVYVVRQRRHAEQYTAKPCSAAALRGHWPARTCASVCVAWSVLMEVDIGWIVLLRALPTKVPQRYVLVVA